MAKDTIDRPHLQALLKAQAALREASREPQAALNAISDLIRDVYQLAEGDTVDLGTGEITRTPVKESAEVGGASK